MEAESRRLDTSDSIRVLLATGALTDQVPVGILHLSDPHFVRSRLRRLGSPVRKVAGLYPHSDVTWDAVRPLVMEEGLVVDLLVVSGDLTSMGDPPSLRLARDKVDTLASELGLTAANVVVVPGNHDRFLGYIGYIVRRLMSDFETVFSPYCRSRQLSVRGERIIIYPFDSTEQGFRIWPVFANTGLVTRKRFNEFNKVLLDSTPDEARLIVLHHHPLPVPTIETKALTIMKNGGTFMAHMQKRAADLVLHGHEHHPYSCRISYDEGNHDTVVVSAGTVCQDGPESASMNYIEWLPRRRVVIRTYAYGEAGFVQDANRSRAYRLSA